ncbi:MAG: hypothetical protein M3N34_10670 [Pseudomonadota bacterium]|nr:hypothetical protein [Pseudomonadota bacterium]
MSLVRVGALPDEPLSAAAQFYAAILPQLSPGTEALITLVFHPADHTHRAWRLAAVQNLARRLAPIRVNAVASADEAAIAATARYLANAPGVTGQYLPLVEPVRPPGLIDP